MRLHTAAPYRLLRKEKMPWRQPWHFICVSFGLWSYGTNGGYRIKLVVVSPNKPGILNGSLCLRIIEVISRKLASH